MSETRDFVPPAKETEKIPEYIRNDATVFEYNGVKYGYTVSYDDLYVDGPNNDEKYDACYVVRPDGLVDGDNGAVLDAETPEWVFEAVQLAQKNGDWV